jgi:hypothetical protein
MHLQKKDSAVLDGCQSQNAIHLENNLSRDARHRPLSRRQPGRSVLGGWSYAPQDEGKITEARGLWEGDGSGEELAYGFELKCAG